MFQILKSGSALFWSKSMSSSTLMMIQKTKNVWPERQPSRQPLNKKLKRLHPLQAELNQRVKDDYRKYNEI